MRSIYLDHQSATPLLPEVFAAMRPFLDGEAFGNPSSLHQHGLRARDAIATAREQVAAFLGAESPEEILFTSDGTESVNLAVQGVARAGRRRGRRVVAGAAEHPAVLESLAGLEREGFEGVRVPVNGEGVVDVAAWESALQDGTLLACVGMANHDLGTIQPLQALAEACAGRGVPLLIDAEAAAGWMSLEVRSSGAALLSFSPHRLGGPKGVGVLYRHRRARLTGLLHGGRQEGGLRPGVENVAGIVGAGAACAAVAARRERRSAHVARLQARLWDGIRARVPFVKLNGPAPGPGRLGTILNVSVEFVEGEGLLLMLDTQGVSVASGTTCASPSERTSPVLRAIGLDEGLARASVIFSPGESTTEAEIDDVLAILPRIVERLRGLSPLWDEFQRGEIDSVIAPRAAGGKPGVSG